MDGGEEEVVIESLRSSHTNWDVTAEGIYYVDQKPSAEGLKWVVKFFSFASTDTTEVAELQYPPFMFGPALGVSADGRRILSTQNEQGSDLMLVENFR